MNVRSREVVLEVWHNGRRLCVAGAKDGVLTACVEVIDVTMPDGAPLPASLRVDGLKDFTSLTWPGAEQLAVGDVVSIRVLTDIPTDEPQRKPRPDADAEEAQERLNYERLRRKYGG